MNRAGIQLTALGRLLRAPKRIARKLRSLVRGTPPAQLPAPSYNADHLVTWHKTLDFLTDPQFVSAYQRGMDSGHRICREPGSKTDIHIEWRVHVILWAAWHASKLEGDFVECGVNTGIYSLALCHYLNFNHLDKGIFLFDTFAGIPDEQINEREKELGRLLENEVWYEDCYETARKNFGSFPRAVLVRGKVPDTLTSVPIRKVCYLSIDMNIVEPERAAIEFFWDKLSPGAPVILDDYGWSGFVPQKEAMDEFAAKHGAKILTLPTGQGLLLKPPA
jgi:O-methyltransferase